MKILKTVIVDDEPLALKLLSSFICKHENIDIVAECSNGKQAIDAVIEHEPDLLFLDIEMPGVTGLEVIEKLQADVAPMVVFTTAYEEYALDAFDLYAVDYILKPIDQERIQRSIDRALERVSRKVEMNEKGSIVNAIGAIHNQGGKDLGAGRTAETPGIKAKTEGKIVVKDGETVTLLKQEEIEWVDAAGDYVCLHVKGVTHIKRSTMKELLEELNPEIFKRVHRSTIVNLKCIEKIDHLPKGEFMLYLGEYDRIKVSRKYREVIKGFLGTAD